MKKGFTLSELIAAILVIGLVASTTFTIVTNFKNNSNKTELIERANLYISYLNTSIIDAQNENKDVLYQTYLPQNENETVTFNIENIRIDKENKYKGIIKVTYEGNNKYKYKIAIHNGKFMIGATKKMIESNNIKKDMIKDFNSNSFYN